MPLNKTQIKYLTDKLSRAHFDAKANFAKANPHTWDSKVVKQKLIEAGFVVTEFSYVKDVYPPLTDDMKRNKEKAEAFYKASDQAYSDALDVLNLGDTAEALALLRDFTTRLEQLARV